MATRNLAAKPQFGLPSAAAVEKISTAQQVQALHAAHFRFEALMADLEQKFENEASVLRERYINEVLSIHTADA